ncbi:sulfite exporter TauE/SafE family protein [Streptomyces sp. XM4193]|uniref:sulfite exporter TauE/SafE family protein n=1 Tax=Streptomyces sp. XM4193 TaxID=2929782 RepID=UPI001FFB4A75|nr:sulfite exporter TauE/SafE family protein [Streptomyces sp. XM4193]MCK1794635.1 sulfite exporter TauE/SafE family protein [Streptomyces sp. XM4193]
MDAVEALAIGAAAIAAGGINAVVGSGTLITFPTLLAFGYPPVLANVSNTLGLVPGTLSAAWGYRRELRGQLRRVLRFGSASLLGGLLGALLLLKLPESAFDTIVPVLILSACLLVLLQSRINRWTRERRAASERPREDGGLPMWCGVLGTGVYGGYFGAAQGVILMGLFGSFLQEELQRLNAVKNVLASLVNGVAAVIFIAVAQIAWKVVLVVAVGATIGGLLGARIGRRLPPAVLRGVIIAVGITAGVTLMVR